MDDALKKTAFENHLKEDWKTVHNIWPNIGARSGVMSVSANLDNNTTTMANVTGLTFTAGANNSYGFNFFLCGNTTATGCSPLFQFIGPGGPTRFCAEVLIKQVGADYLVPEEVNAFSTPTTHANWGTTSSHTVRIEGILVNGANTGAVQLQFKAETEANTITIEHGSWGEWHLLD